LSRNKNRNGSRKYTKKTIMAKNQTSKKIFAKEHHISNCNFPVLTMANGNICYITDLAKIYPVAALTGSG
jgi:hypothetical protein